MSVSHFVDEMTRDRYSLAGILGTSIASYCFQVASSAIASSVMWLLFIKLQPFSLCWEDFEELSIAN